MTLLWPLIFFLTLTLAVLAWVAGPPVWRAARRERIRRQSFPAAWRDVLRRRMPAFAALPADLQLQLKKHVQVLLAEKPFIGCAGLIVTEEMRVLIAAQAALLLLNRPAGYFRHLRQILGVGAVARQAQRHVVDERRVLVEKLLFGHRLMRPCGGQNVP